ncbi:MAG: hypothetical protein JSW06_05465 [Thermoplasmatales archaeon]|nr:MAG: hypothetical protein JSW06_05465 [Thermoplasmatales archaeon]
MNKKILGLFSCILLITINVLPVAGAFEINREHGISFPGKPTFIPRSTYEPEGIDFKDAAFHSSYGRYHGEWWYFEGIFDNGYSIVIDVIVCSKGSRGICKLKLNIYNHTNLEVYLKKIISLKEFEASEEFPFVKVSGKQIIKLDREKFNNTGEWVYNVSLEIDNQEVNLQVTGTTKGWKGKLLRGWYGPVLPMADIEGTLILNGDQINVSGLGYHEHAWNISFPIWEWGWYWGKIVSDSFSLFWAKTMKTRRTEQQRFAILSQNQLGYININPENIKFKATEYIFDNRRIIPTKFILNISDSESSIYINATMETINTHHIGFVITRYWRYHVKVNGEITYGSSSEMIEDEIQLMELRRFR